MSTEWIAPFQEGVMRIEQDIVALVDQHRQLGNNDADPFTMQRLVLFSHQLSLWIQALPRDEIFWMYVSYRNVAIRLEHDLRRLAGLLDTLAHQRKVAGRGPTPIHTAIRALQGQNSDPLYTAIKTLQGDCAELGQRTVDIPRQPLLDNGQTPATPRPSSVIVGEICLHNYPDYIHQPYSAFHLTDWPLVRYDFAIYRMIQRSFIAALFERHQREPVNLSVTRTSAFFEIAVTHPALHLRPEMWRALVGTDSPESLYEMGYQIEPLTWNTGLGEGVIVRLPWATR